LPDFSVPFFFLCMALFTLLPAAFPYLRGIVLPPRAAVRRPP
jgi:hypothetical protein